MNASVMRLESTKPLNKQDLIKIYQQHSPELFRYAVRLLNDKELAEDCVSETFSRFLQVVRRDAGPIKNVRAYLYRVAHNWITDHYRRQPVSPTTLDEEIHESRAANPSFIVSQQMEKDWVRKALLRLPADQQQVIQLRFLEDWSYAAIAEMLGKTIEATRALQYRGFVSLRQMLAERNDEVLHG